MDTFEPNMDLSRDRHMFGPGPKRILSLDGGGVRGLVALGFLERIESILRERSPAPDEFRLSDYYDLIGGTSTGAIIATGLALGFPVGRLIEIYENLAQEAFQGMRWHRGIWIPKFKTAPLMNVIRRFVGEETLGSEKLLTGLGIVAKRLDTDSVWVFHNNPRGVYFDPGDLKPDAVPNRALPLVNIIRASTAAPTYFEPELIEVSPGLSGAFVDGGVSPHHNPGLILLMLSSIHGYGFRWPMATDKLSITSVGTGMHFQATPAEEIGNMSGVGLALAALSSMVKDNYQQTQAILQWLGRSPTPWPIDTEIGDLADDHVGDQKYFEYQRYDVVLEPAWLRAHLNIELSAEDVASIAAMDKLQHGEGLLALGRAVAARQVQAAHFRGHFDLENAASDGAGQNGPAGP